MNLTVRDIVKHWTDDISQITVLEDVSCYDDRYKNYVNDFNKFCQVNGITVIHSEDALKEEKDKPRSFDASTKLS